MIEEAKRGDLSLTELSKKYGIRGHCTISKWMRKLDGKMTALKRKDNENDHDLRNRIKDLEKLLEYEKLKRLAAETMIEVAEKELNISIRKKSETKQSNA